MQLRPSHFNNIIGFKYSEGSHSTNNVTPWCPFQWNSHLALSLYPHNITEQILSSPPSYTNLLDHLIWKGSPTWVYSLKGGFNQLLLQPIAHSPKNIILKISLFDLTASKPSPPFCWKLWSQCIPTGDVLQHHHIPSEVYCFIGCQCLEKVEHLFF